MKADFKEYKNREVFVEKVADTITQSLTHHLSHKESLPINLGLSGGSTPKRIYECLSHKLLPWQEVKAIVCDERRVDIKSDDFNANMIKASLLQNQAKACEFIPFDLSALGMTAYRQMIAPMLPLDICLLGMGADGHTASIFHDGDNIDELLEDIHNKQLLTTTCPRVPQTRVTLTLPVLQQSQEIHVLIWGKDKRRALEQALTHNTLREAPILGLTSLAQTTVHYCP